MKSKNLAFVLAAIRQAQNDPRLKHVHGSLRKAEREFEIIARSGKIDHRRVALVVKALTDALDEALTPKRYS